MSNKNEIILLKLGEVVLKGLNKRSFEQRLMSNIRKRLKDDGKFNIYCIQSTIYLEPEDENCDLDYIMSKLKNEFGVVALSRAAECEKNEDAIFEMCRSYLADEMKKASTFKVETKRSDKAFHMTSIELSQYVGGLLAEAFPDVKPQMKDPDLTVCVEVRDRAAYVHGGSVPGAGGLPRGAGGRAITLLSGGIDSPVASYMIAKRGVQLTPVHFFSFPYTSEAAKQKVLDLAQILTRYTGPLRVLIVPFTRIQEEIHAKCPENYGTLIMRRFMMRIAERIAEDSNCKAIITGESLGQVASQTLEAMACTQAASNIPVLQPLIGMDKTEIIETARKIDTFETAILPFEDCCTVFTPRHPATKPSLEAANMAEEKLDIEALVSEAILEIGRAHV